MSELALSKPRVAKNALTQVMTLGLETATFGVASVAVARTFGPRGLGAFSPAWQLAVMLSGVALAGVDQLLIRELNRTGGARELSQGLGLASAFGLALGGAAAITPLVVGAEEQLAGSFAAAGAYIAVSAPALILRASFHARERMELETGTIAAESVVGLALIPVALALDAGPAGVIGALVIGRLTGLVVSIALTRRLWPGTKLRFRPSAWRAILHSSLPLGIAFLFTSMVLRFDIVIVGALRSAREAGLYAAASVATLAIPMAVSSLNRSLYPVLSRADDLAHPELGRVFRDTWRVHVHLGLGIAAGLTVVAAPGLELVYGGGFDRSAGFLAVLAWLLPVRFLNSLCSATLNATSWRRREAAFLTATVVINISAMLVLVPMLGAWGAIAAAAGTETGLLLVFVFALRELRPPLVRSLGEGALIAAAVGATSLATPGHVLVRTAAGTVVFAALFVTLRTTVLRHPRTLSSSTR